MVRGRIWEGHALYGGVLWCYVIMTCLNTGVMVAVVLVSNLIKRHPNCSVLLHRKNAQGTTYMYTHT